MADVPGKFYRATKVRTGVSPSSAGSIEGEPLPPVNPPGSSLNSVGLTMPSAFTVSNSPLTANGTIGVAGAGTVSQYIRGDGSLADFPESSGGGGSVSYYLNGSVNQGTIGGVAYKELNKVPILGAGTDFTINADGYIASFITDAGDPNLLEIPGGNWNFETYFSSSSSGGTPTFYVELYKYDGTTFTLIASSVTSPEFIAFGTTLTPYFSTLAVPTTVLALTDRLAIRYYVTHSGRTITLHTENNHLCQIITTFTTGLTALNGLTAQVQNFAVGTTGTDFNIASAVSTHTFNLPTASATNRGALSAADWSTFNSKQNALTLTTTGSSGAATLVGATLNIPNYGSALSGYLPLGGGIMTGQIVLKEGTDSTDFSKGLRFPNDPYGGGSDISGLRLYQDGAGTEKMVLELYIGNDVTGSSQDRINFRTAVGQSPDNNLVTINDNIIWNAGNITPVPTSRTITINGTTQDLSANRTFSVGTVTSVTASSPLASSGGTTPNITIQQASGSQSGFLSSTDWTTFNSKQNALTNPVTGTGTTNYLPKFTGSTTIGNSQIFDNGTNVGIGTNLPNRLLSLYKSSTPILQFIDDASGTGSTNGFLVYIGGVNAYLENISNGFMSFQNAGAERMRIFNDGNLLIQSGGTFTNNGARLQVSGTATFSGNVTIGAATAATNVKLIFNGVASKAAGIEFQQSGTPQWYIGNGIASEDNNFELYNSNGTMAMKIIKSTNAINFIGAATFSSTIRSDATNGFSIGSVAGHRRIQYVSANTTFSLLNDSNALANIEAAAATFNGTVTASGSGSFMQADYFQTGSTPATSGGIRLGTQVAIRARNVANTGNIPLIESTATDAVAIASGGANVGIGTASPNQKLEVNGRIRVSSNGTNGGDMAVDDGGIAFSTQGATPIAFWRDNYTNHSMRISAAGRLLINKTNDEGFTLDVNGTGRFTSNLYTSTALYINTTAAYGFRINSEGNNGFYNRGGSTNAHTPFLLENSSGSLLFKVLGDGAATFSSSVSVGGVSANTDFRIYRTVAPSVYFSITAPGGSPNLSILGVNGTDVMSLTATGNVLIGTTTDSGNKLEVAGTVSTSGNFVATSSGIAEIRLRGGGYGVSYNTSLRSIVGAAGVLQFGNNADNYILAGNTATGGYLRFRVNCNTESISSGSLALTLNANATAVFESSVTATSFFESSDATLKTLIQDNYQAKGIDSVVAKLYIKNGKEELGYFAQELQGVLPSAVSKGSDGLLNLSYREVHTAKIAYLEEEIKELKEQLKNK
jgi:hypothetical protein